MIHTIRVHFFSDSFLDLAEQAMNNSSQRKERRTIRKFISWISSKDFMLDIRHKLKKK